MRTTPPIIPVGQEPPPMYQTADAPPAQHQKQGDAKGKPDRRKTAKRFGVLNGFVDFTIRVLSRAEALVWLVLWRDTKSDGIARTSQSDIARRTGVNVRTVKRTVGSLHKRGLLVIVNRGSLRKGPSSYRVAPLIPQLER
jgi:hypothetical protein